MLAFRETVTPTKLDAGLANSPAADAGSPLAIFVDRIEPVRNLSSRLHPFAVDSDAHYTPEPLTLVVIAVSQAPAGMLLTVRETRFDQLPPTRRTQARNAHDRGREDQTRLIGKRLSPAPQ